MKRMMLVLAVIAVLASQMVAAQGDAAAPSDEGFIEDLNWAQVQHVVATRTSTADGAVTWRFDVTVEHNDEGWDHYADAWEVVDPETGDVIAIRVLTHPHDNEQPFTRSLTTEAVPPGMDTVVVRARCQLHGFGGVEVRVDLTADEGPGYEVRARD